MKFFDLKIDNRIILDSFNLIPLRARGQFHVARGVICMHKY